MTVYFISGLGADKYAFRNLQLPEGTRIKHLDWIDPEDNESLAEYAARLAESIDTSVPFSLVGLSMGGMVAIEMSRIISPEKIVLISSAVTPSGIPYIYRLAGKAGIPQLVPYNWAGAFRKLIYWYTGSSKPEQRQTVDRYLAGMNVPLIRWSLQAILSWKNSHRPRNLIHLHGTRDRLLPFRLSKPDVRVEGGGHLMVLTHSAEISAIITDFLELEDKR